jgi:effector-binding domain-containing protein
MMSSLRLARLLALLLALAPGLGAGAARAADDPAQAPSPGAQAPAPPNPDLEAPSPLKPGDAFGEPATLPERTIIYLQGHSNWGGALDTLVDAFKSLDEYLAKQGIKADGPAMTIYTETDDKGFGFRVAVPVAQAPASPPKGDIAVGQAPTGKALKFTHRGAYDAMDETYEAIINYLDGKGLEAKDVFVEEYPEGRLKRDDDNLLVNVFVPVK